MIRDLGASSEPGRGFANGVPIRGIGRSDCGQHDQAAGVAEDMALARSPPADTESGTSWGVGGVTAVPSGASSRLAGIDW